MKLCIASLFLFSIVISYSCKKESIKDYYVPDSIRSYVSFKAGSYWIYKDDSTGTEDSIWVTKLKSIWEPRTNSNGDIIGNDEEIICTLIINGSNKFGYFDGFPDGVSYILYDFDLAFNFNPNYNGWNTVQFRRDSLIMDSIRYNYVLNVTYSYTSNNWNYYFINAYAKSGIGILKWTVLYNDGHSKRQHLVRYYLVR